MPNLCEADFEVIKEALHLWAASIWPAPDPDRHAQAGSILDTLEALVDRLSDEEREAYVAVAREEYQAEGQIEIDSDAVVSIDASHGDPEGAYVQAWVWVSAPATEEEKREEEARNA